MMAPTGTQRSHARFVGIPLSIRDRDFLEQASIGDCTITCYGAADALGDGVAVGGTNGGEPTLIDTDADA